MINVWKLSIKPGPKESRKVLAPRAFDVCRREGLIGVGWSEALVNRQPVNVEDAFQLVQSHEKWNLKELPYGIDVLFNRVQSGDHVWIY